MERFVSLLFVDEAPKEDLTMMMEQRNVITTTTPPEQSRAEANTLADLGRYADRREAAGAVYLPADTNMTSEVALQHLRRKITMQMTSGAYGLMRCWVIFRNKSGSTKDGITYPEFCRGMRAYGLALPEEVTQTIFRAADNNNNGFIQIREFTDTIMGRWNPASTSVTSVFGKFDRAKEGSMVDARPDATLTMEAALLMLRQKISQRLKSGPYGLLRCWTEFRQRAGSSKDGITLSEFKRGLKAYGIPLKPDLMEKMHAEMDVTGDGYVHIQAFIDHIMGRWSATANTVQTSSMPFERHDKALLRQKKIDFCEKIDENLTVDGATLLLRRAITQRLKSGPNGLMRCWFDFRRRAGSTREGITLKELSRGLKCYGIMLAPLLEEELFEKMQKDGFIHIADFIDVVMGRWTPSFNSGGLASDLSSLLTEKKRRKNSLLVLGSSSEQHQQQQENRSDLTAEAALRLLRGKIAVKITSGSHGLQRAWKAFRQAAGADHVGVTQDGFKLALCRFGLSLRPTVFEEVFQKFDLTHDGLIHEAAFFKTVMGRCSSFDSLQKQPLLLQQPTANATTQTSSETTKIALEEDDTRPLNKSASTAMLPDLRPLSQAPRPLTQSTSAASLRLTRSKIRTSTSRPPKLQTIKYQPHLTSRPFTALPKKHHHQQMMLAARSP